MERMAPGLKRMLTLLEVGSGGEGGVEAEGPGRTERLPSGGTEPPPLPAGGSLPGRREGAARTAVTREGAFPVPAALRGDGTPAGTPAGTRRPARVQRRTGPASGSAPLRLSPELRKALKRRKAGPHPAGTIDVVRQLYERTTLSYRDIAARTGVSIATITRHARRGYWLRPETGFPEEHYTPEGRRRMRRQALAERLLKLAEWQVDRKHPA